MKTGAYIAITGCCITIIGLIIMLIKEGQQ